MGEVWQALRTVSGPARTPPVVSKYRSLICSSRDGQRASVKRDASDCVAWTGGPCSASSGCPRTIWASVDGVPHASPAPRARACAAGGAFDCTWCPGWRAARRKTRPGCSLRAAWPAPGVRGGTHGRAPRKLQPIEAAAGGPALGDSRRVRRRRERPGRGSAPGRALLVGRRRPGLWTSTSRGWSPGRGRSRWDRRLGHGSGGAGTGGQRAAERTAGRLEKGPARYSPYASGNAWRRTDVEPTVEVSGDGQRHAVPGRKGRRGVVGDGTHGGSGAGSTGLAAGDAESPSPATHSPFRIGTARR